jgi:hypothetical protein
MNSKVKQFFFEKKNQKTFAPLRAALQTPGTAGQKFFAELFYKKATASFPNLGFQQ